MACWILVLWSEIADEIFVWTIHPRATRTPTMRMEKMNSLVVAMPSIGSFANPDSLEFIVLPKLCRIASLVLLE